jgi:hypothetical protein
MRLRRPQFENCCVHVTHRCQERRFLLRFEVDRRRYQQRLFEASVRGGAKLPDYGGMKLAVLGRDDRGTLLAGPANECREKCGVRKP